MSKNKRDTLKALLLAVCGYAFLIGITFGVCWLLSPESSYKSQTVTPQATQKAYEKATEATGTLSTIVPTRVEQTKKKAGEIANEVKQQVDQMSHSDIADQLNYELSLDDSGG